jgi:two-component system OmpR family response regulator|tara:strand:+ start:200 stop:781 length:582 start_codon:yes stop_codon:yes gene_type:complete
MNPPSVKICDRTAKTLSLSNERWLKRAHGAALKRDRSSPTQNPISAGVLGSYCLLTIIQVGIEMGKLKILHIEDDADIQVIAKLSLENIGGFNVHQCLSGEKALEDVTGFSPDLFLLDVIMPEMSGDVVYQKLKKLPGHQNTPAIFMTARAQSDEVAALKKLGAIEVIIKPFDPMTLPDQIQTAFDAYSNETR